MPKNSRTTPDTTTRTRAKLTRKCAAPGCPIEVSPNYLMCKSHWQRVPMRLRAAVNRAWRLLMLDVTKGRLAEYRVAREEAIASFTEAK